MLVAPYAARSARIGPKKYELYASFPPTPQRLTKMKAEKEYTTRIPKTPEMTKEEVKKALTKMGKELHRLLGRKARKPRGK